MEEHLDAYCKVRQTYDDLTEQHTKSLRQSEKILQNFNQVYEQIKHRPNQELLEIKETFQTTYDTWNESTLQLETLLASTKKQLENTRTILHELYGIVI
jgi:esterase/lipase